MEGADGGEGAEDVCAAVLVREDPLSHPGDLVPRHAAVGGFGDGGVEQRRPWAVDLQVASREPSRAPAFLRIAYPAQCGWVEIGRLCCF
jgi:hypothetical protein